jgi:hypothetical protein
MGSVFEFKRKEPMVPHIAGTAVCCECKHEWAAVVEQAAFDDTSGWLECPACGLQRGRFKYAHVPPAGTPVWVCSCENDLFNVTRDGVHCPNCGTTQEFPR